jgi:flagellar basal body-associated protein FliL
MMELISLSLGLVGTLLAIGSGILWIINQKSTAETKKYAAEREFGHIKRNQDQLSTNLANYFQDIENKLDTIKDSLQEIKFYQMNKDWNQSSGGRGNGKE